MASLPSASQVTLADCAYPDNYNDLAALRSADLGPAMLEFLSKLDSENGLAAVSPSEGEGEVDGVYFKVQGTGTPLVLLPLGAAPSQWEPLLSSLAGEHASLPSAAPPSAWWPASSHGDTPPATCPPSGASWTQRR